MSHHQPHTGPTYWQVPPPQRRRRWPWVVLALVLIAVMGVCIAGAVASDEPSAGRTAVQQQPRASRPVPTTEPVRPVGDQPGAALDADDIKLKIRKTGNQCFGAAGCLVDYRITVTLNHEPPAGRTYLVTYEVRGVRDGPIVDTFTLYGTTYDVPDGNAQTRRQSTKLTAVVTTVEEA